MYSIVAFLVSEWTLNLWVINISSWASNIPQSSFRLVTSPWSAEWLPAFKAPDLCHLQLLWPMNKNSRHIR